MLIKSANNSTRKQHNSLYENHDLESFFENTYTTVHRIMLRLHLTRGGGGGGGGGGHTIYLSSFLGIIGIKL